MNRVNLNVEKRDQSGRWTVRGGVGADVGAVDADRQVLLEPHNHDTTLTSPSHLPLLLL